MTPLSTNRWVKFLRSYGPIPTNDNMYDEHIQKSLRRHRIAPLKLPAPYLSELIRDFSSETPCSQILTGTAGDGKTYRCREVWLALGGEENEWLKGEHVQTLKLNSLDLVVVKDLSEMQAQDSVKLLQQMAADVVRPDAKRVYLIAANHGQLLEKLKEASQDQAVKRMLAVIEEQLHSGTNPDPDVRLKLKNLSRNPDAELVRHVIDEIVKHPGWECCAQCPVRAAGKVCPIWENKTRLSGEQDNGVLRTRLMALVQISILNDQHFPVRQLLILITNALLGHPDAADGLLSCADVPKIVAADDVARASVYGNLFGANLPTRQVERTEVFRKLNAFGIGGETSNAADNLLVYGADDPDLQDSYRELVLGDPVYGGTSGYARAQQAYLESYDPEAKAIFLAMLRAQRQRLFFTLPERHEEDFELWDLTVFRFAGLYLKMFTDVFLSQPLDRRAMPLLLRGLNRLFTGMLVQNEDQLVLATSGSLSQSKRSPLLDEIISVPKQRGEEVSLLPKDKKIGLRVRFGRGDEPKPEILELTPIRFEFLGRVAEGSLPSSFSLECQEDLLAFKARLLAATEQRRKLDEDDRGGSGEIVLSFIKVGGEGMAEARRVTVRE